MPKIKSLRDIPEEDGFLLGRVIHAPGVELAEKIGRFEPPFEYLKSSLGGFVGPRRFLLNKVLLGDETAFAAREYIIRVMRNWRLDDPLPEGEDLERAWGVAHNDEFQAFARLHYPWVYSFETAGRLVHEPDTRTDSLLDYYICDGLAEYGFSTKTRKAKQNYWRCHSHVLSRRLTIYFDKGSYRPSTKMSGDIKIDDIGYVVPVGDPFFFSNAVFLTSVADDIELQMERFFREYIRIFRTCSRVSSAPSPRPTICS